MIFNEILHYSSAILTDNMITKDIIVTEPENMVYPEVSILVEGSSDGKSRSIFFLSAFCAACFSETFIKVYQYKKLFTPNITLPLQFVPTTKKQNKFHHLKKRKGVFSVFS